MKNFYTFEGTEGSGKTTALKNVRDILEANGHKVFITREPGGTGLKTSEMIRSLILQDNMETITPVTEFLLYLASRKEHIEKVILPKISEGYIVISDRYNDSSVAYQGYAKSEDPSLIKSLGNMVIENCVPEKTFFIDIKPQDGIDRIMQNRNDETNRFDHLDISFHNKVYDGYMKLANEESDRFVKIDGYNSPEVIAKEISEIIENGK